MPPLLRSSRFPSPSMTLLAGIGAVLVYPALLIVAIGTFDGVHIGHRSVVGAAVAAGPAPTVITFHPHPREVLGYRLALFAALLDRVGRLK